MKRCLYILAIGGIALICGLQAPFSRAAEPVTVTPPKIVLERIKGDLQFTDPSRLEVLTDTVVISVNGSAQSVVVERGKASVPYTFAEAETLQIIYDSQALPGIPVRPIPLWLSILPPLIAIAMAFLIKEVYSSLFIGILVGATIIAYYQGASAILAVFVGMLDIVDNYVITTISDHGHTSVIVFLMLIGSTVAIVSLNGGMKGLVNWLSRYAKTPRSGQLVTFIMDLCIFFDDYANTLVVGSTMRPLAKQLRISKEKLSFIVDSTAAPVGALALVTTWIGAELSYIEEGVKVIGIDESPYSLFIASIPYRFYPILMLSFVIIIALTGRDYGPMLHAERRARRGQGYEEETLKRTSDSEIEPNEKIEGKWYNAVIPIGVLIVGTVIGIIVTGYSADVWASSESFGSKIMTTVGGADSYVALLWASITSTIVAIALTAFQKILSFRQSMEALMVGFKIMLPATVVLILAWTLAQMTQHMHTADFVSSALIAWNVTPLLLPALTFILAVIIAFSTGTSWGTMAILYPLVIPVTWHLTSNANYEYGDAMNVLLNVISCILAGAVMGDHCSPISDTTIMSSTSSGCNHLEHVRTQMPYALTVGGVSLVWIIFSSMGIPAWILLILAIASVWGIIRIVGKPVEL